MTAPKPRPRGRPRLYQGTRRTSYHLDADTLARLERLAEQLGVSRAEVIRVAVREMEEKRPELAQQDDT